MAHEEIISLHLLTLAGLGIAIATVALLNWLTKR